jgi:hypothetical protein
MRRGNRTAVNLTRRATAKGEVKSVALRID